MVPALRPSLPGMRGTRQSMFAVETQTASSRERSGGKPSPERTFASPLPILTVQLSSCACGGGCPRCSHEVSQPGDPLEHEADRVAEQVLRIPHSELPDTGETRQGSGLRVSRYSAGWSA